MAYLEDTRQTFECGMFNCARSIVSVYNFIFGFEQAIEIIFFCVSGAEGVESALLVPCEANCMDAAYISAYHSEYQWMETLRAV